jgi:hypothetical protein
MVGLAPKVAQLAVPSMVGQADANIPRRSCDPKEARSRLGLAAARPLLDRAAARGLLDDSNGALHAQLRVLASVLGVHEAGQHIDAGLLMDDQLLQPST